MSDPTSPQVVGFIPLNDPSHRQVKLGRTWFNDADASTTGTFSCASCHPDGHTDQLLWVIKTPIVTGGNQIMPRSTMPIRGLRDTAPFHWDGIPGDPYGGNNSANIHGTTPPNSSVDDPASSTRHVIDGGLAATMLLDGDKTVNDEGKSGALSAAERDDMATFLLSVTYPPAQRRAYTNVVSKEGAEGFKLFHIDGDLDPSKRRPNVCGNCHRMPFLVSTNTPGTGMDAPTWRGAYDRFLILPQGRLNIIEFDFYRKVAERGIPERSVWQFSWGGRRRFDPVWDMVLEGSTGFSGSFARQVTLNKLSANDDLTDDMLSALELSASEYAIVLDAEGVLIDGSNSKTVALQFNDGRYVSKNGDHKTFTREHLVALASSGKFVGTFTARHGVKSDVDHPQPAIWTLGPIEQQRGRQEFPILYEGNSSMTISGRHIRNESNVIVDGRRVPGTVSLGDKEKVVVNLATLPSVGMHLLQIQNPNGLFSNDFIFHVSKDAEDAEKLKHLTDQAHIDSREALARAISRGDLKETRKYLGRGARRINERHPRGGSTPLGTAALHGRLDIAKYLIERGAKIEATNQDGNTPLHVATFMCRAEIVRLLLDQGASPLTKNKRGKTPLDAVSSPWSQQLADLYGVGNAVGLKLDLKRIERERPQIVRLLKDRAEKSKKAKDDAKETESIEKKTKVHRLESTKRAAFDAFAYINRVPEKPKKGETAENLSGRIFSRLANQEGRILLKMPPSMGRQAYLGFKTFLRYEGSVSVGNCAACHTLPEFTDLKTHVVTKGGSAKPTPSLRNLGKRRLDLRKLLMGKIAASQQKRAGKGDDIDAAYASMNLSKDDISALVAFLKLLDDVSDKKFRSLILNTQVLDTSENQ